jgi:hypothetical protein
VKPVCKQTQSYSRNFKFFHTKTLFSMPFAFSGSIYRKTSLWEYDRNENTKSESAGIMTHPDWFMTLKRVTLNEKAKKSHY